MASTKSIPKRKTKSTAIQLGKLRGFQIPDSIAEWEEIISQNPHLRKLTINTLPSDFIASASKASESQYLMLRSFREFTMSAQDLLDEAPKFGLTPAILQSAEGILERRFLQLVGTPTSIDDISEHSPGWPGSFAVVRRLHEEVMRIDGISDYDRNHRELPIAEDEATVNTAAIVFLQTISHLWVHNRVHLTCGVVNEFEAFTDGVLRSKRGDNKFSIVETKKASSGQDPKRISIQETCQLASWHMEESSNKEACFNGQ
ncbi:uncharacterized protein N7477_005427 [Penicillium maclennaniae]|uniref:uncharacterized protein n=1 Tax=Penicillium maclennaniae TaxID=1343394 RepID=UPI00253FDD57|nr:uncharacterized protein N7477_005427 [Penicillium maclennaniae]KAJ5670064.1 hypothetical protein N7477_005427 [Penicillium maclennaniae]